MQVLLVNVGLPKSFLEDTIITAKIFTKLLTNIYITIRKAITQNIQKIKYPIFYTYTIGNVKYFVWE